MNKAPGARLTLGLILTSGLMNVCQGASADSIEADPIITMHIHNYAGVSPKTLLEAEKVTAGIFRKAGVEIRWCNRHVKENNKISPEPEPFYASHITLHILSRSMAEGFGLTFDRLGFAPGQGPNRGVAYVFYDRAEHLARQQRAAQVKQALAGWAEPCVGIGQIMGLVIAHEVGHLLGFETHSPTGIMRADWNSADLQESVFGKLFFTLEQSETMRAEVSRRIERQQTIEQDGTALKLRAGQNGVQRKRN